MINNEDDYHDGDDDFPEPISPQNLDEAWAEYHAAVAHYFDHLRNAPPGTPYGSTLKIRQALVHVRGFCERAGCCDHKFREHHVAAKHLTRAPGEDGIRDERRQAWRALHALHNHNVAEFNRIAAHVK